MNSISANSGFGRGVEAWADAAKTRAQVKERMFDRVDTDGSGGIDKAELQVKLDSIAARTGRAGVQAEDVFAKVDTDGDGSLSKRELNVALKNLSPKRSSTVELETPPAPPSAPTPSIDATVPLAAQVQKTYAL